jgi:hypothetical protein
LFLLLLLLLVQLHEWRRLEVDGLVNLSGEEVERVGRRRRNDDSCCGRRRGGLAYRVDGTVNVLAIVTMVAMVRQRRTHG